jgi:hypothetical protein
MMVKMMGNKLVIKIMSMPIVVKILTLQMKVYIRVVSLFSRKKSEPDQGQPSQ